MINVLCYHFMATIGGIKISIMVMHHSGMIAVSVVHTMMMSVY